MALNFPNTPLDGDTWVDPSNGALYIFADTTQSWSVTGISVGGGTVNSVTITGSNGIEAVGGPITDVGSIDIALNIDNLNELPPPD
jgi:hypothetical protein